MAAHQSPAGQRRLPAACLGVFVGLVVLAAVAYVIITLVRTVPALTVMPVPLSSAFPGPPPGLAWPGQGEAAAGVQGVGVIAVHGSDRPTPIASLAKVMTAYIILRDHPLGMAGNGPEITVTPADVAVYRSDLASGQSVVAVRAGERLAERQALEGLLLPSGNNIASLLARWDAGSEAAFLPKVNAQARALGLAHTRYVDSSGVQAGTVSTAGDQVRLAMLALNFPAFAQIVAMPQVRLPVAGLQYNLDALLGRDGIVGIKTGSTSQAGGCFVFAAHELVGGRTVTVAGSVLDQLATGSQPSIIAAAFTASTSLLASVRRVLVRLTVVRRGATLAWVEAPWGERVALRAAAPVSLVGWPGLPLQAGIASSRHAAAPLEGGQSLGTVVVAGGEERAAVRLATSGALPGPSLSWRLAHP